VGPCEVMKSMWWDPLFGSELDFQLLSSSPELVLFGSGSASGIQSSSGFGFHEVLTSGPSGVQGVQEPYEELART
jgi:hypothetical protein